MYMVPVLLQKIMRLRRAVFALKVTLKVSEQPETGHMCLNFQMSKVVFITVSLMFSCS